MVAGRLKAPSANESQQYHTQPAARGQGGGAGVEAGGGWRAVRGYTATARCNGEWLVINAFIHSLVS